MKKIVSFLVVIVTLLTMMPVASIAAEPEDILLSKTVEVLDNGDVVTYELYKNAIQPRAGISGYNTCTHSSASGVKLFSVTVHGTFSYNYGISSSATSASAEVSILNRDASFISKSATKSGATATAYGTVSYSGKSITRSVSISCDKYGNLS